MREKIKKTGFKHIKYNHRSIPLQESIERAKKFYELMKQRRSLRFITNNPVPFEIIETIIKTAGTSPSGAHQQPWTFVVVSNPDLKKKIRIAAEKEEKISYEQRMTEEWLNALIPLGTDWRKPFLEEAPYLIIVFRQNYGINQDGTKRTHYYSKESVGIAVGILIAAIHNAGLVTLTHTPSPMNFLREILDRPKNEIPFIVLPVGYPQKEAKVPDLKRKKLSEIMINKS